jgi:hypothetical protein
MKQGFGLKEQQQAKGFWEEQASDGENVLQD